MAILDDERARPSASVRRSMRAILSAVVLLGWAACSGNNPTSGSPGRTGNGTCVTDSDCKPTQGQNLYGNYACCQGSCVDVSSSVDNCGKCGKTCTSPNASCQQNTCVCAAYQTPGVPPTVCSSGQLCCNRTCLDEGPANCGACGQACSSGTNCVADSSGKYACTPYTAQDCGPNHAVCNPSDDCCNGACATTTTDCGKCGRACPPGEACRETTGGSDCFPADTDAGEDAGGDADPCASVTCSDGKTCCVLGGLADCVDLSTDALNCGACNAACAFGEACVAQTCIPADAGAGDACVSQTCPPPDGGACLPIGTSCGDGGSCCPSATCGAAATSQGGIDEVCCLARGSGSCVQGQCCALTAGGKATGSDCTQGKCCEAAHLTCGADSDCCPGTPGGTCATNFVGAPLPFGRCCVGDQGTCQSDSDCCDTFAGYCVGGVCCRKGGTTCLADSNCCAPYHCSNGSCQP